MQLRVQRELSEYRCEISHLDPGVDRLKPRRTPSDHRREFMSAELEPIAPGTAQPRPTKRITNPSRSALRRDEDQGALWILVGIRHRHPSLCGDIGHHQAAQQHLRCGDPVGALGTDRIEHRTLPGLDHHRRNAVAQGHHSIPLHLAQPHPRTHARVPCRIEEPEVAALFVVLTPAGGREFHEPCRRPRRRSRSHGEAMEANPASRDLREAWPRPDALGNVGVLGQCGVGRLGHGTVEVEHRWPHDLSGE